METKTNEDYRYKNQRGKTCRQMKKRLRTLSKLIQKNQRRHKLLYGIVLLATSFILFLPVFFELQFSEIRGLGIVGVFFLNLLGSATLFFPAPAILSVSLSATQNNPLLVAFVAAFGSTIGEGTTFLFGFSSTKIIDFKRHKIIYHLTKLLLHKWKGLLIILFAFIPNPFFDGLALLAGIAEYPIRRYMILTFIGRMVRNILIAYLTIFLS